MNITSNDLRDALGRIGRKDSTAVSIEPPVIAMLIELQFLTLSTTGLPRLTEKGEHAFTIMESGDGKVPELDNYEPRVRK
jgi:hypothetical protein